MSGHATELTLVVPGLLGPFPVDTPPALPRLPALQRLLSRAQRHRSPVSGFDFEHLLFELFNYPLSSSEEPPAAPLCRLADGLPLDERCYLRADPVQMIAEQDKVYLTASDELAVNGQEAVQLVQALNALYAEEGWSFDFAHPQRLYLALNSRPDIRTTPTAQVMGASIHDHLPGGNDALQWHAVMNEIQMLLFHNPVNIEREARGQKPINGLWLWGAGRLAGAMPAHWQKLWSDEPLSRGLALHAGIPVCSLPDDAESVLDTQEGLVIVDGLYHYSHGGIVSRWTEAVQVLEQRWFSALLRMLGAGVLQKLTLYPVNGEVYTISARQLRRWWRRDKTLRHFVG